MPAVFTPEHSPLDRIFAADTTYRIPAYQRPYSWQAVGKSDRDGQVIQMWQDLWSFFEDNRQNTKEYFLGSMVIVEDKDKLRTFEVIDGQQRLTTLLLLFAAMRCFLREVERMPGGFGGFPEHSKERAWLARSIQKLESFLYNEVGPSMLAALKLKVERTLGANFNQVLNQAVACEGDVAGGGNLDRKHGEITARYFKNRDYFLTRFQECFLPTAVGADLTTLDLLKLDEFFAFLRTRVALVLIKTSDFSTAYRIFEILNNRGLPLSNLDLLRNFVLEELTGAKEPAPEELWERLETQYTFTEDFIGRWTESINAAQPQASSFNDAKRMFEGYRDSSVEKRINLFCHNLEQNLSFYNLILEEDQRIEDIGIRRAVTFIKLLGNERYSFDLLLALFRFRSYQGGSDPEIKAFLHVYRTYALHVVLLGRFSSPKIYEAIKALNVGRANDARRVFALKDEEKKSLASSFDGKIEKNDHAKLLLAAYVWRTEEDDPDVVTQQLMYEKSTLEHIIPQDPAPGTNWLTDFTGPFREEFTYRLGNMTLLTQAKNSANRNFDFSKKRPVYAKTKLPLTVTLAEQSKITEQTIKDRQQKLVAALRDIFLS